MPAIRPECGVDAGASAVGLYELAFSATRLHLVGEGEDIVAQLAIGQAGRWVAATGERSERPVPGEIGTPAEVLLVVDDAAAVQTNAVAAGATEKSPVDRVHGWLVCGVVDPWGHAREIG